jgi:hypothetical protein
MDITDKIAIEALERLDETLKTWDQPYYGDLEARIDWLFEEMEKNRRFLAAADKARKEGGLIARPNANDRTYRRFHKEGA